MSLIVLARASLPCASHQAFKILDDSLTMNSVSRTTCSGGKSVDDSMFRIRISAAFLPISLRSWCFWHPDDNDNAG
ncbi:MAG: hypothetical protein FJ217_02360 [Ignavibacteria bacterium]|nr:hypothetical protein [Ignavibacteria bacterium]